MRIDLGPEVEKFRGEVRDWIKTNRFQELDQIDEEEYNLFASPSEAVQEWVSRLRKDRWLCVAWPEEYGGRGLGPLELSVVNQEFAAAKVPRITMGMGEWLVGPSIIAHATEEQKAFFLPRIVSGEDRYCQGFSEPDAGSDLAGLKTKGVVEGDEIIVTGQKVWTSGASRCNMVFTLARTDPEAPKHNGISYVLVPMDDNNVTYRPIKQITGESHFFEVFYDGARAPMFNVIGGLNNGWKVAMTTLGNERGATAATQHLRFEGELWDLVDLAKKLGKSEDPLVRQHLAWAYTHVELMRMQGLRILAGIAAGKGLGPESSINKLFWSEYHKRLGEVAMEILGPAGFATAGANGVDAQRWWHTFLSARAETIYAGTSEIQRKIISERVLGLPRESQVKKAQSA
ncbi:MAG TPA: acyl-CoA dehydrogenase family protein [Actinomycetota bacterium]|nr:acyl-CoA dehydrogenase family protein [Actinomycetota bacterium]